MFFELLMLIFFSAAAAAVIHLVCLTAEAVIEQAREWWGSRTTVIVVDPSTSRELERIAAERGSRRHKRFVYNKSRSECRLVESDTISAEVAHRLEIELYVA
jgi:hypothetical protein